ncbi:MAG: MBOAT family protein [Lachnospiraceae bacterium]|nr:MBOAT family protein [Lachnospiraceae bacterium]
MLFNSFIFILAFLPITIIGYFGLNRLKKPEAAKVFLIGMSLWFYGYFRPSYLIILVLSILVNYGFYLLFTKKNVQGGGRKALMIIGVVLNLGTLGYFKYLEYLLSSFNVLTGAELPVPEILLPLGISFFTFQQVGFVIDAYKGQTGNYRIHDYALFVSFFPQLVAGPIVTHDELIPQFNDSMKKRLRAESFTAGITFFVLGLSKKILIADVFAKAVDYAWQTTELLSPIDTAIAMFAYYVQIYFDFSGYSDMAIGLGKMLNFDIPTNFDSPYKALTIRDYWKRWHITLTRFLTKYLYIPLGGSRKGKFRTYLNTLIVFIVSGIWHGAGGGYVVWGLSGGIGIVICRMLEKPIEKMKKSKLISALMWIFNTIYLCIFWTFFRGETIGKSITFLKHLIPSEGHANFALTKSYLLQVFRTAEFDYALKIFHVYSEDARALILTVCYILLALIIIVLMPNCKKIVSDFKPKAYKAVLLAVLFIWCFVCLSGVSTYIYYNF